MAERMLVIRTKFDWLHHTRSVLTVSGIVQEAHLHSDIVVEHLGSTNVSHYYGALEKQYEV